GEWWARRSREGFSDAIVPANVPPERRVEAILGWMQKGPARSELPVPTGLAMRNPQNTLNYEQLLAVCGTATNAFLNLARSSDLEARRLLLLTPERNTKHVVAEVRVNDRWIVVDPTYRSILRYAASGHLNVSELSNPQAFP